MKEALECYQSALNAYLKLKGTNSMEFAKTLRSIGWVHLFN